MSSGASEGCYHAAMSKSVTVIKGAIWRQRSVTWNRNVKSEPMRRANAAADGPAVAFGIEDAAVAGVCPDDEDSVYEGREFRRRMRMS